MSDKQANVDTCQLPRDDDGVSSRKGDSGAVLSSASKKASRSERRLISMYIDVDQG